MRRPRRVAQALLQRLAPRGLRGGAGGLQCPLDPVGRHIEVSDRPHGGGADDAEAHTVRRQGARRELPRRSSPVPRTSKITMLVSTRAASSAIPGSSASPAARRRARSWSSASRSTWCSERVDAGRRDDAGLPHRAAEPLLVDPRLLDERARPGQHRAHRGAEPLGEVEPDRVELGREGPRRRAGARPPRSSAGRRPCARPRPASRAAPRHRLDLARAASRRRPRCSPSARSRPPGCAACSAPRAAPPARTCAAVNMPARRPGAGGTPPRSAPPRRRPRRAAGGRSRGAGSRRPARQCTANATWLHIVPDGRKSAASLPSSSATISCSRLTVGSSSCCSSPTSASHMKRRIAAVGRVTVSL